MHPPPLVNQQPKQHAAFISDHPTIAFFPARLVPVFAYKASSHRLDPLGLNAGHTTCKYLGGLYYFAREHPRPTSFTQGRPRRSEERRVGKEGKSRRAE